MKLSMLALLIVLAVGTAFAQDVTASPAGNFYADSLKSASYPTIALNGSARDTVDVVVSSMADIDYYEITVSGNGSAADTLVVSALTAPGTLFAQRAVISLASGSVATTMIIPGVAPIDYIVLGAANVKELRFTSPGATNDMRFIVHGKKGYPSY
jgi:hypothetical protein